MKRIEKKLGSSFANREENSIEPEAEDGESSTAKDSKESDKFGGETPADSPAISSKADTPIPEASGSHDGTEIILDDEKSWPATVDLNTRLRRVITSYQRIKKDDGKNLQKGKPNVDVGIQQQQHQQQQQQQQQHQQQQQQQQGQQVEIANHASTATDPPLNMQGWDLQQLAMYLLVSRIVNFESLKLILIGQFLISMITLFLQKMERREKMEAMVKERERTRIEEQKAKWTRREENEFLRVVSSYGVNYDRKKAQYDWTKFKSLARFDKKTDADFTDYYMSFRALCKKICNTKMNEDDGKNFSCFLLFTRNFY